MVYSHLAVSVCFGSSIPLLSVTIYGNEDAFLELELLNKCPVYEMYSWAISDILMFSFFTDIEIMQFG